MKKYTAFILAGLLTLSTVSCATDTATTMSSAVESVVSVPSIKDDFTGVGRSSWLTDSYGSMAFIDGENLYFYDEFSGFWLYSTTQQNAIELKNILPDSNLTYKNYVNYPSGLYATKTTIENLSSSSEAGPLKISYSFVNLIGNPGFRPIELTEDAGLSSVVNNGKYYQQTSTQIQSYDLQTGEKSILYETPTASIYSFCYDEQYLYFQQEGPVPDYTVYRFSYANPETLESFNPGEARILSYAYDGELYFLNRTLLAEEENTAFSPEDSLSFEGEGSISVEASPSLYDTNHGNLFSKAPWGGETEDLFTNMNGGLIQSFQPYQDGFALLLYDEETGSRLVKDDGKELMKGISSFVSLGNELFCIQQINETADMGNVFSKEQQTISYLQYFYIDEKGETHEIVLN